MNRFNVFIFFSLWLTSLAVVAIVTTRINSCGAQKSHDSITVEEILDFGRDWNYVTARKYTDGGTWDLGFQDANGYFIYIRVVYKIGIDYGYRKFYIGKSLIHNRGNFVEITRGSDLEKKVIDLIENSRDYNTDECKILPDKSTVVALIRSRDIRMTLDVE